MPGSARGSERTFEEIGKELGITRQCAQQYYASGIRKLRRFHPLALHALRELSQERHRERNRRELIDVKR